MIQQVNLPPSSFHRCSTHFKKGVGSQLQETHQAHTLCLSDVPDVQYKLWIMPCWKCQNSNMHIRVSGAQKPTIRHPPILPAHREMFRFVQTHAEVLIPVTLPFLMRCHLNSCSWHTSSKARQFQSVCTGISLDSLNLCRIFHTCWARFFEIFLWRYF